MAATEIEKQLDQEAAQEAMLRRHSAAMEVLHRDGGDGWYFLGMVIFPSEKLERASAVKARSRVVTIDEVLAGG